MELSSNHSSLRIQLSSVNDSKQNISNKAIYIYQSNVFPDEAMIFVLSKETHVQDPTPKVDVKKLLSLSM
jgi:hypothetical protein